MKQRPGGAFLTSICLVFAALLSAETALATHPLVTDDTSTQGKGKVQLELNGQLGYERQTDDASGTNETTKTRAGEVRSILSYGLVQDKDLVLSAPYQWQRVEAGNSTVSNVSGAADASLEVKWRFYEREGLSFAVKPGLTLPTGGKEKGLGTGRATFTFFFISTKETERLAFHTNLGYKRNENDLDQRKDIWHASAATEWKLVKDLKFVADIGAETNPDKTTQTAPAFILGGFVYSLTANCDLDAGLKGGLNKAEKDYTFLGGLTFRF